jgi:hypothetical protein
MIPAENGLEIGPGHGRFTVYLKDLCKRLRLVDVTAACIAVCRQRFAEANHLSYHVNDGSSLVFVPPRSLDFVFSFDALVHAETDMIEAYLSQLGELMRPDALAFLHHSNLAALDPQARKKDDSGRATTVSAELVVELCRRHGLDCIAQELVPWGSADRPTDCFSVFTPHGSKHTRPLRRVENLRFMADAATFATVAELYDVG